jgi:hypothetical protein
MLRQMTYEDFSKKLKKLSSKDNVNESFSVSTKTLFNETNDFFKNKSSELIFEGSGWGEQVTMHERELQNQLKSFI